MANGKIWTDTQLKILEEEYSKLTPMTEIEKKLPGRTSSAIGSKAMHLGLTQKYIRPNNAKFKAIYQDYDWCYDHYINRGMSFDDMAIEAGCTKRVIEKWCSEIHRLHRRNFKEIKHLSDLQRQIILFGTLGDGHIDNRKTQPMYIESHSIDEKDYLFWKYDILKDLCNQGPVYYKESTASFGTTREYKCQPFYRINTRILNDLLEIREMPRIDKIRELNEFGFCLHILDDGSRSDLWQICLAEWTQEEMDEYQNICKERFDLDCSQNKDGRYYSFTAISSKKIDEMILRNIPNELDIVHKKIIDNDQIKELCHYRYVIVNGDKIGLSSYCRMKWGIHKYEKAKAIFERLNVDELIEEVLLGELEDVT